MKKKLEARIKRQIIWFIVFLVLSGITAFPIQWELELAHGFMSKFPSNNEFSRWYFKIYQGVNETWIKYPFIAYGTDWLAFAHLVIGVAFIGAYKNPVRNIWVIEFGMIACAMVFPLALIAGEVRGIPFFWRLIDCLFGVFGIILLYFYRKNIKTLGRISEVK